MEVPVRSRSSLIGPSGSPNVAAARASATKASEPLDALKAAITALGDHVPADSALRSLPGQTEALVGRMTGHLERLESDHSADRKIVDYEVGEPVIQELRSDANQLARQMHRIDGQICQELQGMVAAQIVDVNATLAPLVTHPLVGPLITNPMFVTADPSTKAAQLYPLLYTDLGPAANGRISAAFTSLHLSTLPPTVFDGPTPEVIIHNIQTHAPMLAGLAVEHTYTRRANLEDCTRASWNRQAPPGPPMSSPTWLLVVRRAYKPAVVRPIGKRESIPARYNKLHLPFLAYNL